MSSSLCISIQSTINPEKEELTFYVTDDWTVESEKDFIAKILDILSVARRFSKAIQFNLTIETSEVKEVLFLIEKKVNNQVEVKNHKLSIREIEVLGLIMQGLTNLEIAEKLFISFETVRSHRKNILEKSGAKNTAALINYYHQTFFEK